MKCLQRFSCCLRHTQNDKQQRNEIGANETNKSPKHTNACQADREKNADRKISEPQENVAVPIPKPRNCSGKISDRSNRVIGLIAPWKNARKIIIMVMVVNARHEEPAGKRLAKVTPVIAILVPIKPMISNGRRGTCFSNCKVTRVAATAVTHWQYW